MKYKTEIYLEKDEYDALIKDPLYRQKIEIGLECGTVEIRDKNPEPVRMAGGVPA